MLTWARYHARRMIYRSHALRRLAERHTHILNPSEWDQHLATDKSTYLGGTVSIDARNSLLATLIRHYGHPRPKVLDVGCAGGSLSASLAESIDYDEYFGVDISSVAIAQAQSHYGARPATRFTVSSLQDFEPSESPWNVIVLGEVLYYLPVDEAVAQVGRYAKALLPDGLICISMKDDGKSQQIYRSLHSLTLREALLIQAKISLDDLDYRIRVDRARPAYLIAAFARAFT